MEKKMDRRVRKTRALLQEKLIQLMNEKDIKDISVKELSDLADINRGTFYLHYNDVFDMLNQLEEALFQEFNAILDHSFEQRTAVSPNTVLLNIFTYIYKNQKLVKVMIGPHGDLAFINRLKTLVRERLKDILTEQTKDYPQPDFIYAYIVSGYVGVIETWMAAETPCEPQEVADLCEKLVERWLVE